MFKIDKPLPMATEDTAQYWDGARDGKLRAQKCDDCGFLRWPPASHCARCLSPKHAWVELSGRGKVFSFIIVHKSQHPAFWGDPFNVAIVELDEGPRLHSNVVDVDPTSLAIGMPVEVVFEKQDAEISLPKFRPV